MNAKQLLKLLALAIVVVAAGLLARWTQARHRQADAAAVGGLVLPGLDVNQAAAIRITDPDGTLELRQQDGLWRVVQRDQYRADFTRLSALLRDLAELKAVRPIEAGPSQFARLGLEAAAGQTAPAATTLQVLNAAGQPLAELRLGKPYRQDDAADPAAGARSMQNAPVGDTAAGRFLLLPKTGAIVLVAKPLTNVTSKPMDWVDHDFVKLNEFKHAVLAEAGHPLWEVSRNQSSAPLALAGLGKNETADDAKLSAIGSALSWFSFAEIAPKTLTPEAAGLDAAKTFTAADFDGNQATLTISNTADAAGRLYVTAAVAYAGTKARTPGKDEKPADKQKLDDAFAKQQAARQRQVAELQERLHGRIFLVEKSMLDAILRQRAELLAEKPKPAPAAQPGAPGLPVPPAAP